MVRAEVDLVDGGGEDQQEANQERDSVMFGEEAREPGCQYL